MTMANSDLKASVLMNLRSVTQSRKGGVPLRCLERDYKDLLGTPIPVRDLGYTTLQAFLKDIPDVITLKQKDGQLIAEGVADSTTAHIVSLVNRQKTAKVPPKVSRRPSAYPRRGAPPSKYSSRNLKSYSPKRSNSYKSSSSSKSSYSSKPDTQHSKPSWSEPAETKPKVSKPSTPSPPKAQNIPPRKYDVPPRFLRLQQQQKNVVDEKPVNNVGADFEITRPTTPETPFNYISEPVSNHHIKSPRPLLTTKNIEKIEPLSKRLESAATNKEYVEIYAKENNLTTRYKSILSGQKKRNRTYFSSLCIGTKKYDSYPTDAATAEEAEEIAASIAVEAIKKGNDRRVVVLKDNNLQIRIKYHLESCPQTTIRNAEDVQKVIARIEEIVCEKPSGMFTNGIVHEYENSCHEKLPENWLSLLHQSSLLEIEELDVSYSRVPDGVNCIVRRAKFSSGSTTPSSLSEFERSEFTNDDSTPRAIVRKDHLPAIPELTIPFGNEWAVYIVDVSKTIAARLIDYDNQFLNLLTEMSDFYCNESLPAQEISEGLLYATCDPSSGNFQRVLVQKIKDPDLVECYYVDEGVFADVLQSNLQELHTDFWNVPYQAIHLTLDGLEDYPYKPDDLDFLRERCYMALVKRWSTTVLKYFPDDPAVHKIIYSVVLYDTAEDEDVNLNDIVKEKMLESLIVKLPKLSVSASGYYLSHVEEPGEIYLRNISDDSWLEEQLEKLSPSFEEARLKPTKTDAIFAARYEDGLWYRAVYTKNRSSSIGENQVEVYFIDYGNKSIISSEDICDLQPFSEFLSSVGPQALKCELYSALPSPDAEWTSEATSKLMELAPISEELLIRVINEGSKTTLPQVNLYKRVDQNGDSFIISINESLANKPELFRDKIPTLNSTANNLLSNSASFENTIPPPVPRPTTIPKFGCPERSSSSPTTPSSLNNDFKWAMTPDNLKSPDAVETHDLQPLNLPEIPDEGQEFDIFVTQSANPGLFYVQPYLTNKEMTDLMTQMNQFYSSEDNLIEMELSLLKTNEYYAVKHTTDGAWYRAQLQSIMSDDPVQILVKYVDFGDFVTVNMSQLQSLYSNFRHLPCQAIKASLAGIKPVEKDWRPLHCVEFKSMVDEKTFVSKIVKKTLREYRGSKFLELELILIDVSNPQEDVYIHDSLVARGIARPA